MLNSSRRLQDFVLVSFATLLALSLFASFGTTDTYIWLRWISNLTQAGFQQGYGLQVDYPPVSNALMLIAAQVGGALGLSDLLSLKLGLGACLLLTIFIFWYWTRNLVLTMALQIALTPGALGLTLVDILFAPTLIGALWALQARKLWLFAILYTVSFLIKWQPLIIAPFLLVYLLALSPVHGRGGFVRSLQQLFWPVFFPGFLTLTAVFFVVGIDLFRSLPWALNHPWLSGDALNFNWILTYLLHVLLPQSFGPLINGQAGNIVSSDWRLHIFSKILFGAAYLFILIRFTQRHKSFETFILYALAGYLAYFIFNTGVHETHLFMAVILTAVLVALNPGHLLLFVNWALAANLNLFIFWGLDGHGPPISRTLGLDLTVVLALLNVLLFLGLFVAVTARPRSALTVIGDTGPGV